MTQPTIKCLIALILTSVATGYAAPSTSAYAHYQETPKILTELEWRLLLVRVNSRVTDIKYDSSTGIFTAIDFVLTTDLQSTTSTVRAFLESRVGLVAATLRYSFPEFGERGGRDLRMEFKLGRTNSDLIAVYKDNKLEFTKEYYDYIREIGK